MRKTLFAGITVLSPDESVTSDNGAFVGRDRDIIDRLLEVGAKTHRHTGLDGIPNPVSSMGASAITSGGTIRSGQTFSLGYTLEDDQGGETILSPMVSFSTAQPINPASLAPAGQVEYEVGGDLPVDTYYYVYSFIDGEGGETPIGPVRTITRDPGFPQARVSLSGFTAPMSSAGAVGWRLYRAVGGGDFGYLASGTGNSFVDDGSLEVNCDLTPVSDQVNTTNSDNSFVIHLPSADVIVAQGEFINVYMTDDGSFTDDDALLEQFPLSSAGKNVLYRSLNLLEGHPPDVNNSIGGAHQIDPDTELLDWRWKRPVSSSAALGSGTLGDVRLAEDSGKFYAVLSASAGKPQDWTSVPPGSEGGGTPLTASATPGAVTNVDKLTFRGSGGVDTSIQEPESGHALITIDAPEMVTDAELAVTTALISGHIADGTAAHGASAISYAGGTGMSATDVEGAVDELATEKADKTEVATGDIETDSIATVAAGTGNLEWEHNFTDSEKVKGVLVLVVANDTTPSDEVTSVTLSGAALDELSLSPFLHSEGSEDGVIYAYFIRGRLIPEVSGGTLKVTVSGATTKKAVSIAIKADEELRVEGVKTLDSAATTSPSVAIPVGTRQECITYAALHSGADEPSTITPLSGNTTKISEHDFGTTSTAWFERTARMAGTSITIEAQQGSEEAGMFGVAIGRVRDFGLVTALPTVAGKGDTCRYIADKTNGVIWDLIYDGEGEFPWKKIGGPPLTARSDAERELSKTVYTSLPTDPLSITTPLKGDYDITIEALMNSQASGRAPTISYAVGATAASDNWCAGLYGGNSQVAADTSKTTRQTGVAASAKIEEKARNNVELLCTYARRRLTVDPVRVG